MKRLTKMSQLNDPWFLMSNEGFKELLKQGLIQAIKTGEKKDRDIYIFVHDPFFVEFSCNKDFSNIRIKKQPHKVTVTEEDLNNNLYNVNVAYTGYHDEYGNQVEKIFTIVKNGVPVVYSYNIETGDISEIELK